MLLIQSTRRRIKIVQDETRLVVQCQECGSRLSLPYGDDYCCNNSSCGNHLIPIKSNCASDIYIMISRKNVTSEYILARWVAHWLDIDSEDVKVEVSV